MLRLSATSWQVRTTAIASSVLLAAGVSVALSEVNNDASADTENCVTHAEYDQTDVFMNSATIESIYDVWGQKIDTPDPDTFARIYRTCWAPDTREVIVRYDDASGLSINWNVRDK